jgi:hypothetical protein
MAFRSTGLEKQVFLSFIECKLYGEQKQNTTTRRKLKGPLDIEKQMSLLLRYE